MPMATPMAPTASIWSFRTSAREMASLGPDFLKVPSASNLHFEMLGVLCDEFGGKIQLSLGMTTQKEEDEIVDFFEKKGRNKDLLIYACTSGYPVPADQTALLEITRLKQKFDNSVEAIGFSGHHLGIALDVAAVTLGAEWIEIETRRKLKWSEPAAAQ